MSFSEQIEEDELLQYVYEKIVFNKFHKKIKQLKQENNKRYVYQSPELPLRYRVKLFSESSVCSLWVSAHA